MNKKIYILLIIFLLNINIALAQTGIFNPETGNSFIKLGVSIIITFFIVRALGKAMFVKQK